MSPFCCNVSVQVDTHHQSHVQLSLKTTATDQSAVHNHRKDIKHKPP